MLSKTSPHSNKLDTTQLSGALVKETLVKSLTQVWQHKEIILIVMLATLLRVWQLDTHLILFGDAAADIQKAVTAVQQHQLPLLGIASSIPRFKQGPLTVWLEMVVYAVAGVNLTVYGVVFALLGIAAVIGSYELFASEGKIREGLVASFLLAFSPLAIAHSRMPYHIVPIPVCLVIYLWQLRRLSQTQKVAPQLLLTILSFCLLFQFELALAPLVLLIGYVLWRKRQLIQKKLWWQVGLGFAIGLLPQLIFDLTHRFAQLGGFVVWVGYRIVAFGAIKHAHGLSLSHLQQAAQAFGFYITRIWSVDQPFLAAVLTVLSLVGSVLVCKQVWGTLKKAVPQVHIQELAVVSTFLLTMAYVVHGSPSEAYFPPFELLFPLLAAVAVVQLLRVKLWLLRMVLFLLLASYSLLNITQIWQQNFFVSTAAAFSYGPSLLEQHQIVSLLEHLCTTTCSLTTTRDDGKFENFFAGYRLLDMAHKFQSTASARLIYVEGLNTPLEPSVNLVKYTFPSVVVFQGH